MIPGFPSWGWALVATVVGGGLCVYFWRRLVNAENDRIARINLEGQQKAEAVVAKVEREVEEEFKKQDEKGNEVPPSVNDFKF